MKYNQGVLETVVRTVPVGDVVADTAYVIGAEILVAVEDGTAGAVGVFVKRGCCGLEFLAGDEPAAGAACYLNNTTHKIEATPSATNYLIGCRNSNLESDIPATHVMVDLDGTAASVYVTPGDIQGVTAGTGLSGGGTSGTVTLSIGTSVVTNTTGDAASEDLLVASAAADRSVKATSIAVANVPQMAAASAGEKKVVRAGGADKTLVADGPDYDLLPTMAAAATAPGTLIQSAGADRTQSDSGIVAANVPQMPAVGGVDELLYTTAEDRSITKSGIKRDKVMRLDMFTEVEVTIAIGATSGSSAADPTLIGGKLFVCYPKSGNDKPVVSYVLNGDGSVTVTVAAAESAEAKFEVMVYAAV